MQQKRIINKRKNQEGDYNKSKNTNCCFHCIEVVTLVAWLAIALAAADVFSRIIAAIVLIVGFTIEHIISYNVINNKSLLDFRKVPIAQKAVVSVIETSIWILWLILASLEVFASFDAFIAAAVLAGLLIVEHTISDNVFKHKRLFERFADKRTIVFSIIEASGAAIWLVLVQADLGIFGIIVLAAASFVEHTMAVALGRKRDLAKSENQTFRNTNV